MPGELSSPRAYREAALPEPSLQWRQAPFSVVDLELTGLDPSADEIVSYAAVSVTGGRVSLADACHGLVRPSRTPAPESIRVHGLREADLVDAPPLQEAVEELLAALTGRVLVAHVAEIEVGFLRAALSRFGLGLRNPVVDTAAIGAELGRRQRRLRVRPPRHPAAGESSPGLSKLARVLGLPVHRPHQADGDALTAAQVFVALAAHLERYVPVTVGSLA